MQDYLGEGYEEEREREIVDALAERETFFHVRGDDRADEQLRCALELFACGASLPSIKSLPGDSGEATNAPDRNVSGHMSLLSQPPALSGQSAPGEAGGHIEEAA